MQSTLETKENLHVAIIMDGNGRWATRRGLPRSAGHRAGIAAARKAVEAAPDLGIAALTLFAFSSDNWRRPKNEVEALMGLLRHYLRTELHQLIESGTRLTVIGRRDRLPYDLAAEIRTVERGSAGGGRLHLQIAIDYSSRTALAHAAAGWLADDSPSYQAFRRLLAWQGSGSGADVDLLIRSGGEKRLSDFLLWECAYAEFCFIDTLWPDFGVEHLRACITDFRNRERRFGGLRDVNQAAAIESAVALRTLSNERI